MGALPEIFKFVPGIQREGFDIDIALDPEEQKEEDVAETDKDKEVEKDDKKKKKTGDEAEFGSWWTKE